VILRSSSKTMWWIIPKTTHKVRRVQNFDVFDFSPTRRICGHCRLDAGESAFFSHYDPATVEYLTGLEAITKKLIGNTPHRRRLRRCGVFAERAPGPEQALPAIVGDAATAVVGKGAFYSARNLPLEQRGEFLHNLRDIDPLWAHTGAGPHFKHAPAFPPRSSRPA
jgi:hypothetical protein